MLACLTIELSGCSLGFNQVDGYVFTHTGETAQSTAAGKFSEGIAAIDVVNRFGNINLELSLGEPGWKWNSKVWADSRELADQLINELAMDIQTVGKTQTWRVVLPDPTPDLNGVESNLTLMLPPDVKVNLVNAHGDVTVAKIYTDAKLENSHGNIEVTELGGILKIKNAHGDLIANNIGEATIDVSHGDTAVRSATGDIRISCSHGNVEAEQIVGQLSIDASHADIKVDQVDSIGDFKTSHGDIVATNLIGDVKARNSVGATRISASGGNVSIQSEHGRIDLTMTSSNFHSIDLETSHESIAVELPANVHPEINMEAKHGETESEFGSEVGSHQKLRLRSSHGDIRVTKHIAVQ